MHIPEPESQQPVVGIEVWADRNLQDTVMRVTPVDADGRPIGPSIVHRVKRIFIYERS